MIIFLDETDNKVKKTPVEPCLDPLANFMMLMGKQDKNKLPWKTGFKKLLRSKF